MDKRCKPILRGELYYADLSPTVVSEQGGIRPILILQNDVGNRHSPTVIVAAVTGSPKKPLPTHVEIGSTKGISKSSVVLLEQLRTIDRTRLGGYIGRVSGKSLSQIDEALKISVGLAPALF
ncbi:MAG: type II toxin-antitoxin system PemK/MazF family toxin [Oscillospiraceae bacterium]|nr:type II toxin-antitoxin system PemK/MazF family toxin [Oscillospiraceae bacterium]